MNKIVLIDKPTGMTSFGVVARLRRKISEQVGHKVKVGHTGTLDPFATGLMILLVGKATKRSDEFLKLDKWYEATICLGKVSSTGDTEGELTDVSADIPTKEQICQTITQFIGEIKQIPPAFSAIKIDGQRAYKLARQGKTVDMPSRSVQVYELELVDYNYPILKIKTHVSSGTYIRTLAEDIGKSLGTGAYCQELRRTKIAEYDVDDAKALADLGIMS